MGKRNQLLIYPSGSQTDVAYTVYRGNTSDTAAPGINPSIGSVDEQTVKKQTFQLVGQPLYQDDLDNRTWYVDHVFNTDPLPVVRLGNITVNADDLSLNPELRKVVVTGNGYDLSAAATMDYWTTASIFIDDSIAQQGVTYSGPPATGLNPPIGFKLSFDPARKMIVVDWNFDPTPRPWYYMLQAEDADHNVSYPSRPMSVNLAVDQSSINYILQKSLTKEGPWVTIATPTIGATEYLDSDPFQSVPNALGISVSVIDTNNYSLSTAQVSLANPWNNPINHARQSDYYRICCIDDEGVQSDYVPNPLYTIPIYFDPVKVVLRRGKTGKPATLDGVDAITINEWTTATVDATQPILTFLDGAVASGVYGYTAYVINANGQVGDPAYFEIDMR